MVQATLDRYGALHVLHNNVGINGPGRVTEVSQDEWDRVMSVNLTSMILASKHAIPVMVSSGGGAIVNVSSISAIRPRGMTPYTVSKGAVIPLTQAMAIDHARDGIRVNCILPGPAYTSMVAGGMSAEMRDIRRSASPLGIEGNSWDIAYAAPLPGQRRSALGHRRCPARRRRRHHRQPPPLSQCSIPTLSSRMRGPIPFPARKPLPP